MTDHQFDRIARLLSSAGSRRRALAALGALALARVTPASAATQIEIAACGEAGAVCTQIKGCCEGLVCATSYTNPAYGVCVTGEGDMLAVSDDVVVPGAEGTEEELAQEVTDAAADATAGATEAESILAARDTEIQARKTARDTTETSQRTRRRTNQNTQQSRRQTNLDERRASKDATKDAKQLTQELNQRPRLGLKWFNTTGGPGKETLRVDNRDEFSVVISRVEAIQDDVDAVFTGSITILPDGFHRFVFDPNASDASAWTTNDICRTGAEYDGDGLSLTVKRLGATRTHRLTARCQEPLEKASTSAASRHSENKTPKKHQTQKQSKRGKGQ